METCDTGCNAAASVSVHTSNGVLTFCMHHAKDHAPKFAEAGYLGNVQWQGSIFPVEAEFWLLMAKDWLKACWSLTQDEWVPVIVPAFGLVCDGCQVKMDGATTCYQNGVGTRCPDCVMKLHAS